MSAARSLEDLLAKDAIIDVLARYSRTLDWLDDEGQASCFWPDAAIDYGFFRGSAAGTGSSQRADGHNLL